MGQPLTEPFKLSTSTVKRMGNPLLYATPLPRQYGNLTILKHQHAKEMLDTMTAAEVDKIAESKGTSWSLSIIINELIIGLDSNDKAKAKKLAQEHAEQVLNKSGHY